MSHDFLSTPLEIIEEARNGRMFILVDDEDRENEGDLVIPGQMVTPDAINFMAKHGRGLICLAMTKKRADQLGLNPMERKNSSSFETAFTVSIEASSGVTTGISAADRARTISVAIDAANGPETIATPGHVFPLVAREGGVLVRAGHTEAAVDVSRLAGLNPSGVICEIMNDDGTMARMDDLVAFAQFHNMKIGAIRDLIAYRRLNDHHVERVSSRPFQSDYGGDWTLSVYRNTIDGSETPVLQKGEISPDQPTLVRMHGTSIFTDLLGQPGPRKRLLQRAMAEIGKEGSGVIVIFTSISQSSLQQAIESESEDMQIRGYGIGAQILADLGISDMVLLTNSHHTMVGLEGYGLSVVEERQIPDA
ncbi:3,4-dihydroxy-2-butanone-4-phosphate synthase [Emcibacter nanhaiensis]|uniref:3,4-dihydroxy-2-butanone 4-phosphate synthase n=1 Tax=Emcibacter nanhaiensis TaxID=1505037 RepID=A0A501PTF6_9PROT|nr:3,4-dihydroxy-2-butanone-4-phosphate synthase [Emcibacter nanhaiensis]TPD63810.1 3,4-dihydroxy-2-butanone-4-phosphate synthase [Emcibacter nanhaiensis]